MTEQEIQPRQADTPFALQWRSTLWQRLWSMTLLWSAFGALIGVSLVHNANAVGLLSGGIAGVIVMTWLGPILALVGGRVQESFCGGVSGGLVALSACALGGYTGAAYFASLGLIIGGMIGSTFGVLLPPLKRLYHYSVAAAH